MGASGFPKFVGEGGQELVLPPVGVLQGFLGTLPVGHVLGHPEDELGLARDAELWHQAGGVLANSARAVVAKLDRPVFFRLEHRPECLLPEITEVIRYPHVPHCAPEELVARQPGRLLNRGVHEHIPQLPVEPGQDIRRVVRQTAHLALPLQQFGRAVGHAALQLIVQLTELLFGAPRAATSPCRARLALALSRLLRYSSAKTATLDRRIVGLIGLCR